VDDHPFLELHHVSQWFGTQEVLRDVNLRIGRGETLAIVGESGCGKSVTLKLLIGLLTPTDGEVRLQGRPLENLSPREMARARLRFGFLFQGAALFDSLTVADNVAFGLRQNMRMPESEILEIVRDRLHEVGLPPSVCRKKPAELSGGQRKRVGLARALALTPEIMLYDEPTTGLDPIMTDVINELILQTRAQRPVTSIMVTHEMTTVRKVADRVVMLCPVSRLDPGENQIVFDGTPEAAFSSSDQRVFQFVHGQARERLREMAG
jgi:phospholipid/cholesterol/gamma-HCH transport system ATP-binding protein